MRHQTKRVVFLLASTILSSCWWSSVNAWQTESLIGKCPRPPLPDWSLDDPAVTGSEKGVLMEYSLPNDVISDISFQIFDYTCSTLLPTELPIYTEQKLFNNTYDNLHAPILANLTILRDRDLAWLDLEINPYRITNVSGVYTETERRGVEPVIESRGDVRVCVQLSLFNAVGIEVTFVETQLTFGVRFWVDEEKYLEYGDESNCRFGCRRKKKRRELQSSSCKDDWGIQVFTCPPSIGAARIEAVEASESPISQGTFLRLCIQTNQQAFKDGAVLGDISALQFLGTTNNVIQAGVANGVESDGLTIKYCEPGWNICVVESLLFRSFFGDDETSKPVAAQGVATLTAGNFNGDSALTIEFQLNFEVKGVIVEDIASSCGATLNTRSLQMSNLAALNHVLLVGLLVSLVS